MKVIGINGSPKREGNTYHALKLVEKELNNQGIELEIIHVGNKLIHGCLSCGQCAQNRDEKCAIKGDAVNLWIQKMKDADGLILGSPVYYSAISGTMKSFLDRAFYVAGVNGSLFRHKVGASVVAVRRSGGIPTFDQLNHFLNYSEMVLSTSNYWNVIHGASPGEVLTDEEGTQIMRVLGQNMSWLLKSLQYSIEAVPAPVKVNKIYTNFIR